MPTPPYTTKSGLQIGRLYTPYQRPHMDADACLLQEALLAARDEALLRELRAERVTAAIAAVTLAGVLTLLIFGAL